MYLAVDDKPAAYAEDARYMLQWINRLAEIAKSTPDHFPDDDARESVLATYSEAGSRYLEIINIADENW